MPQSTGGSHMLASQTNEMKMQPSLEWALRHRGLLKA
jgi:hypothetical protein